MSNYSRTSSRQVVEAIYSFEKEDSFRAKFTAEEESAMRLWENILNTAQAEEMANIGYHLLKKNVVFSHHNVPYDDLRNWMESYEQTAWSALQKSQAYVTVAPEAHVCLHLLCYMIGLSAIGRATQEQGAHIDVKNVLKQFAEYAWHALLTKTGTSLSPREIKFLAQNDFFKNMMGKLIGADSAHSVFLYLKQIGNRIWFKIFGIPMRPAHACLFVCVSVCAILALCYLPFGQKEIYEEMSTKTPQLPSVLEHGRKKFTKL